ncbi:TPA: KpsF/GutQ family sugar-phosphate isomerase [Vibrio vulnificus]|nr:KpsF/GutQ family sugar-phosphate isomerase [Vibrio vulnificus]
MNVIDLAKNVFDIECEGLIEVKENLDYNFAKAVDLILHSEGRVIVCGMGKSGIIGKKIAASFASTGTPSFFIHPGEAFHGDLGMVKPEDVLLAISNSGETDEILKILPFLKDNGNPIISITGNNKSTMSRASDLTINSRVSQEACVLQLAPTTSTTAALVLGDALVVALMQKRGFKPENFARFHPGGSLGRKLLNRVADEMYSDDLPIVSEHSTLIELLTVMSKHRLGMAVCESDLGFLLVTDGDLRRAINKFGSEVFHMNFGQLSSSNPKTVTSTTSMQTAYEIMEELSISCLLVVDDGKLVGVLRK